MSGNWPSSLRRTQSKLSPVHPSSSSACGKPLHLTSPALPPPPHRRSPPPRLFHLNAVGRKVVRGCMPSSFLCALVSSPPSGAHHTSNSSACPSSSGCRIFAYSSTSCFCRTTASAAPSTPTQHLHVRMTYPPTRMCPSPLHGRTCTHHTHLAQVSHTHAARNTGKCAWRAPCPLQNSPWMVRP